MRCRSERRSIRSGPPGRRGRAATVAAVCLAGAALAPAAHAGVTPELADALRAALPSERIPVLATLENQAEPGPGDGPPEILRALRREAQLTQPGLLARLGHSQARGFWIVNAISSSAIPPQVRRIAADPAVARVDLDPSVRVAAGASASGALPVGSRNWGLGAIRAPQAWSEAGVTGTSVRIGTIDTGVEGGHPVLAGKVAGWRDVVGGRAAPYDDHGHGTHTAGTLVGGNAQSARLGVAPGARLLVAKAIAGSGVGVGSDIIAAAEWLADPDGNPATADFPEVISNAWGELGDANDVWFRPVLRRWRALGIVPIFAAGNSGPRAGSVGGPGGYPEALAVGAVDESGAVAPFSSRGPVIWQNADRLGPAPGPVQKPDLVGPGVGIVSSWPGGGYEALTGTSMAVPHAAGVAALVRSANPKLAGPEVEGILRSAAVDVAAPGRDAESGAGLVDALAATRAAVRRSGASGGRRGFAGARRTRGNVRLTVAQLRINRRIALTSAARVAELEARLGVTPAAQDPVTPAARAPIRRLSVAEMRRTQRICQSALRRAMAVESHVAPGAAGPAAVMTRGRSGAVELTVRQLLINQRIAQAALRRVARAEAMAQASGMLPPR
jgi:Subtilase family